MTIGVSSRRTQAQAVPHGFDASSSSTSSMKVKPMGPLARFRSWSYDMLLSNRFTGKWYRAMLSHVPDGARILDVGIGTSTALLLNKDEVFKRNIRVHGIDIDAQYLALAKKSISQHNMQDNVTVEYVPFEQHRPDEKYDVIYFASSFMLLPDQHLALEHAKSLLNKGGIIVFTQTIESRRGTMSEYLKPILTKVLTHDFGKVTVASEFMTMLKDHGLKVFVDESLPGWVKKGGRLYVVGVDSKGRSLYTPSGALRASSQRPSTHSSRPRTKPKGKKGSKKRHSKN